jgi:uncharacterized protein
MTDPLRRLVRTADHRVVPWRNGRGTTTELAVDPPGATLGAGLRWRLSAAMVTEDGPFSSFPGIARTLVLLEGPVLELLVAGTRRVLRDPWSLVQFDGASETLGRVPEGPVRDLNLMVRADLAHFAEVVRGPGRRAPREASGDWLLVPLGEAATVEGTRVEPLELWVGSRAAWETESAVFLAWISDSG